MKKNINFIRLMIYTILYYCRTQIFLQNICYNNIIIAYLSFLYKFIKWIDFSILIYAYK